MKDNYIKDEFEDYIADIGKRYESVKNDVKLTEYESMKLVVDDIKYLDDLFAKIKDYKSFKHSEYLGILSDFSRSLFYFQKDSEMIYSIPLLQLITYVNTFFSSCFCRFKPIFDK